jgi:hypothetical protein
MAKPHESHKLTENIENKIERVVYESIELAVLSSGGVTSRSIAEKIYESEPDLMEQLKPYWMVDRLLWMVSRKRHMRRSMQRNAVQLALPGFEGLPRRIFLPDGQRKFLDDATIEMIQDHVQILRDRLKPNSKIKLMEAVLDLMRKYSTAHRKITWGEVKDKELGR